jgi:peptidoglycan/LPS O-acetylase OafA/YrhL
VLGYYGFGQIYSRRRAAGGIAQAWTIDTEVAFYIALPLYCLLAYWFMRRYAMSWRGELGLLCGVIALSWVYKAAVVGTDGESMVPVTPLPYLSAMPAYADHFALGMILAVLSVAFATRERSRGG